MIVIVSGMQRSGSTFSYNVVRELLDVRGGTSVYSSNSMNELIAESSGLSNAVIKSHSPDDMINAILRKKAFPCVCTLRKPEDAIASWMNVFGFSLEESVATYERWLSWHQNMRDNMLNIRYEDIDAYPWLVIRRISKYLMRDWNAFETHKIWKQNRKKNIYKNSMSMDRNKSIDVGFSFYDKISFYHRRHVSSIKSRSASELLNKDQLLYIRAGLGKFLSKNGEYHW